MMKRHCSYFFQTFLFLFILWEIQGQNLQNNSNLGVPFIANFNPEEYAADPQNWDIAQDQHGVLYVANTIGLLKYDGVAWEKIELPNIICRSVAVGADKVLYVGSQGDLGLLETDKIGSLQYVSLLDKIAEKDRKFADVWSTFSNEQGVFFYTNSKIFLYDQKLFSTFAAPKKFDFCFQVNDKIYVQDDSVGLCQIANKQFSVANGGNFFIGKSIRSMLPYDQSAILVVTLKDGLFVYNPQNGMVQPLQTSATKYLTENLVFCGKVIGKNRFAIGTFRNGLVIIDEKGAIQQIINEDVGLRNNSVRKIFIDQQQGIWLALNNGINRVELQTPLSIFDKRNQLRGSVNHVCSYDKSLLVGSSLGIFEFKTTKHEAGYVSTGFVQLQGFKDQAWRLTAIKNSLFIGSNAGTFLYETGKPLVQLSPNASFVHLQPKNNQNFVLAGLRNGIEVFEFKNEQWQLLQTMPKLSGEIKTLVQDAEGKIWAGTKINGVYCIDISEGIDKIKVTNFMQGNGLPNNKQNRVFDTSTGIVVGHPTGFFVYNTQSKQFEPHKILKIPTNWRDNREAWQMEEDKEGNFWIWVERYKGLYSIESKGNYRWNSTIFSRIPLEAVSQILVEPQTIWIGTANALYAYNKNYNQTKSATFSVLLRRVSLVNQDSVIAQSHYAGQGSRLDFKHNSLSFDFSATHFDIPEANLYQYQLEGYDKNWSAWTLDTKKDYTNLWNGKYKLKIKAKNIYGEISNEKNYEFEISPPWYRTNVAYFAYFLALIAFLYMTIRFYTLRLAEANKKLEETVLLRTAEIQQQKEEIESQRDNLGLLYNEIEEQKREVEKSYHNVKLLSKIGTELTAIRDIENIITMFYDEVNKLMQAPIFAAGIHNAQRNRLDFYSIDDQNQTLAYSYDSLDNPNQLSVWCFEQGKDVFINNFDTDYQNYLKESYAPKGTKPESLLYVPLKLNDKIFGVITVQAFEKNAYNEYHRTIFSNLANYVSIALDNANAYNVISMKNKQITDSIRYAQTIQKAILPTEKELNAALNHHYFIFYQPKDVVSGDFYWLMTPQKAKTTEQFVMVAVVDCTGHGVPGAFMSLIGATLLNEIAGEKKIYSPAQIIMTLNTEIRRVLRQNEHINRDGMDICFCKLQPKHNQTTTLTYTGAKRTLLCVNKNQQLEVIKSTHKSVGGGNKEHIDFEEFVYELEENTMIYLTSDGYADQNNSNNDKFGSLKFKDLVTTIANLPLELQSASIKDAFFAHKGNELQRDDVTVMGIRV